MKIEIRVLDKDDDISSFECGISELDQFLKQYAKQNQFRHYIGTTYLLIVEDKIVGYVSVSASSIRIDELSLVANKKLPNYPLPILRLTRLAVDKNYQKSGFGKMLLRFVFELSLKQKEQFGCFGLVVDAKQESVDFYRQFGFVSFDIVAGSLDIRPFAQSMFIATKVIQKSI
jgi:ribosomal protein S18 acetylase RimI-like enzyme